jgi:hypothetical protein
MAALASSPGVTYAEIRTWCRWLHTFTASDLADAMGVDYEVGVRGVKALIWHGIVFDTGDEIDGPYGPEAIVEYAPLPPAPTHHPKGTPPEVIAVSQMGGWLLYDQRGLPVRIRSERDMRKILSTSGARSHHVNRERAYERQEEARKKAKEAAALKARREAENGGPKWKRKKKKSIDVRGLR